ncbi:MAG: YjjG family noncanonical pyrimidine nucleotidase [Spirochaetota bacterium]
MAYRLLIFDADNTLFDYDRGEAYALSLAFRDQKLVFHQETMVSLYRRINKSIWRAFEAGEIPQGEISFRRFGEFFRELGVGCDIRAFSASYLGHLAEAHYLVEGAEDVVATLSKSYSMAIVTNGLSRVQRGRFGRSPIAGLFDPIVISDEVGVQKPNPEIFDHVFEAYPHVCREEVLMIGDSLTSDIAGGVAAGIDTCWFNPGRDPGAPAGGGRFLPDPTYEIGSLGELLRML